MAPVKGIQAQNKGVCKGWKILEQTAKKRPDQKKKKKNGLEASLISIAQV